MKFIVYFSFEFSFSDEIGVFSTRGSVSSKIYFAKNKA